MTDIPTAAQPSSAHAAAPARVDPPGASDLARLLQRGEMLIMEYVVEFAAPFPQDCDTSRRLRLPIREYVIDVEFTRPALPARCVQFAVPAKDGAAETERVLTLDEQDRACAVGVDLEPGVLGVRWEWPGPP